MAGFVRVLTRNYQRPRVYSERWGGCRSPQTASQCAKLGMFTHKLQGRASLEQVTIPADSPHDLPKGRALDDKLPPSLAQALAEIGLR